jgi:hypothetical protein
MEKKFKIILSILILITLYFIIKVTYGAYYKAQLLSKYPLIQSIVDINIPKVSKGYYEPILLKDGTVLLFGGKNYQNIGLYDPLKNKFQVIGKVSQDFKIHAYDPYTFVFSSNKFLFLSDSYPSYNKISKKDEYSPNIIGIFDLKTKKFSTIGKLKLHRFGKDYTATLLKNDKILIAGGYDYNKHKITLQSEIFDPKTGKSSFTGNTNYPEVHSKALLLNDGNVLIVGSKYCPDKAELYVTKLGKFIKVGDIKEKYKLKKDDYNFINVSPYLLPDGRVLITNSVIYQKNPWQRYNKPMIEIYDPKTKQFNYIMDFKTKFLLEDYLHGILISSNKFIFIGYPDGAVFLCDPLTCENLKCVHLVMELVDLETNKTKIIGNLPPLMDYTVKQLKKDNIMIICGKNSKIHNELGSKAYIIKYKD